ncbi:hypothetical protein [Escherichia coli]|uniref:hypothetical protein n=1 Tax=Escherichia coli TaxID=562 RepID=UPI000B3E7F90|nr:hypothetical protein [Escherichia coli]EFI2836394.1 hypothetical protein [Escherichia coli]
MNIGKAIINYAARRNIDITLIDDETVAFWEADNDCEWMFSYMIGNDGFLHFKGNVYLPQDIKEELPACIDTEKKLKEVINFIAKEFISKK